MKHHSLKAALMTVLAALLVGSVIHAADPEMQQDDQKKSLDLLVQELKALRGEMTALREEMRSERKELDTKITRLARRVRRLEERVNQVPPEPNGLSTRKPFALSTATIRLTNMLPVQATVSIDGKLYTVPAQGQVELPNQSERTFTYAYTADGYGWSTSRQKFLQAGSTWELTIGR